MFSLVWPDRGVFFLGTHIYLDDILCNYTCGIVKKKRGSKEFSCPPAHFLHFLFSRQNSLLFWSKSPPHPPLSFHWSSFEIFSLKFHSFHWLLSLLIHPTEIRKIGMRGSTPLPKERHQFGKTDEFGKMQWQLRSNALYHKRWKGRKNISILREKFKK